MGLWPTHRDESALLRLIDSVEFLAMKTLYFRKRFLNVWRSIGVGVVLAHDPLLGPGRALLSASGSYRR